LFSWIRRTFSITIERNATPFNYDLKLSCYCSKDGRDSVFGAKQDTAGYIWKNNSIAKPDFSCYGISEAIKTAIISAKKSRAHTVLLLPIWEVPALKKLINHQNLFLLCSWKAKCFVFNSSLTTQAQQPCEWEIGIFVTNWANINIKGKWKEELSNISLSLFRCVPTFHEKYGCVKEEVYQKIRSRRDIDTRKPLNQPKSNQTYNHLHLLIKYYSSILNINISKKYQKEHR
jgi:hypothetical protein